MFGVRRYRFPTLFFYRATNHIPRGLSFSRPSALLGADYALAEVIQ